MIINAKYQTFHQRTEAVHPLAELIKLRTKKCLRKTGEVVKEKSVCSGRIREAKESKLKVIDSILSKCFEVL